MNTNVQLTLTQWHDKITFTFITHGTVQLALDAGSLFGLRSKFFVLLPTALSKQQQQAEWLSFP